MLGTLDPVHCASNTGIVPGAVEVPITGFLGVTATAPGQRRPRVLPEIGRAYSRADGWAVGIRTSGAAPPIRETAAMGARMWGRARALKDRMVDR